MGCAVYNWINLCLISVQISGVAPSLSIWIPQRLVQGGGPLVKSTQYSRETNKWRNLVRIKHHRHSSRICSQRFCSWSMSSFLNPKEKSTTSYNPETCTSRSALELTLATACLIIPLLSAVISWQAVFSQPLAAHEALIEFTIRSGGSGGGRQGDIPL